MLRMPVFLLALLCWGLTHADTAFRWVDQDGKVHYSDRAPPPQVARDIAKKRLDGLAAGKALSFAMQQAARDFPVTLYANGGCGTGCQEGRDYLAARGIPFTEKRVETTEEIEALQQILDGKAMVPVLKVGSKTYKGWLLEEWRRLLDAAGYPH